MVKKSVALTIMVISLASMIVMPVNGSELSGKPTPTVTQPKTAIQSVQAPVKRIARPKLFRSNPHRVAHFALIDDQDDIFIADDDLATGYRRRDLGKIEQPDDAPLPDHIRWRLFLARQMALLKYREIQGA